MKDPSKTREAAPPSWLTKGVFAGGILMLLIGGSLVFQSYQSRSELEELSAALEREEELLARIEAMRVEVHELQRAQRVQYGALTSRIDQLEALVSGSDLADSSRLATDGADDEAGLQEEAAIPSANDNGTPRYATFEVTQPGVEVWQNENGGIQALNEDPALTGTVITVRAIEENGIERDMLITLPAPDG